ncbi:toxin-activating lysine-acyltransferase [Bradyrhizobium sp. HKCCYLS2038]|uniref:toxin-activating lysine-acyltransferase n=1 Tax=unclassified Bradyrhizobium TaxID=2631580 RepID=UPI003EB924C6
MSQQATSLASEQPRTNSEVLGEILWLYAHSPIHQRLRLHEVEQFVMPAIKHNRYRIYKRNGIPIGYVGIARLSKEVEDAWLGGKYVLQPDDWISGDRLWYLQFVVPFGDTLEVRNRLRDEPELYRKPAWGLRPNKNGQGVHVVQFGKFKYRGRKTTSDVRDDSIPPPIDPQSPSPLGLGLEEA